jgi:D-psicose/D-tagatose/L-ribulose 3-epimerase
MRTGINLLLWTDRPSAQHLPLLDHIQRWGFDGAEFPVLGMEPQDAAMLGRHCDELGLKRSALAAFSAEVGDPSHPDPHLREAALATLKNCVDKTRALGADILVGPFHQGLGRFTGTGPTTDDLQRSAEVIRNAAEYAATASIDLAIEPLNRFEMYLTNTAAAAAQFVTQVGMPNVGILADTHHANIEEENPVESWRRVIEHIRHVHISENHRGIPGRGHACSAGIFEMLHESGYDRWLTIEAFGLKLPGLIEPLHLWRPLFDREDDVAVLGLQHIRKAWAKARSRSA